MRLCYSTHVPLLTWGGDDGSDEEAHIRSEGRTNAEAPRGGTQGSGNTQATGDRRQGRSDTEKEQSLGGYQSACGSQRGCHARSLRGPTSMRSRCPTHRTGRRSVRHAADHSLKTNSPASGTSASNSSNVGGRATYCTLRASRRASQCAQRSSSQPRLTAGDPYLSYY